MVDNRSAKLKAQVSMMKAVMDKYEPQPLVIQLNSNTKWIESFQSGWAVVKYVLTFNTGLLGYLALKAFGLIK